MGSVDEPAVRTCCLVCSAWPGDDASEFEVVVDALGEITPRLAVGQPGVVLFPTRGPSRCFGGDHELARRALASLDGAGVRAARAGVADGMVAARLAAEPRAGRGARHVVVEPGGSAAFLADWPVGVLLRLGMVGSELVGLLGRLGLRTLGQVAALDAGSMVSRFGAEGEQLHLLCRGLDAAPLALRAPPIELAEETSFEHAVEHAEMVVFAAKGLAERLFDRLRAHALTCVRARLEVELEGGERSETSWRWERDLTPEALGELVRRWLDPGSGAPRVRGPITAVRLVPEEVAPRTGLQTGLWGGSYSDLARVERLVASLQGVLGPGRVLTGEVRGGRTPLEQSAWVPWEQPRHTTTTPRLARARVEHELPRWPGAVPPPIPARVFDPALPAELLDGSGRRVEVSARGEVAAAPASLRCSALPGGGGEIVAWEGPWLHDLRWWQPGARRRRALWRVLVRDGDGVRVGVAGVSVACLVVIERGRAGIEAIHD